MRALLIDPEARDITEVEYNGDYCDIYRHLSTDWYKVDTFCIGLRLPTGDVLFVDDNGLIREETARIHQFMINGQPQPLTGRGLVVGDNGEGDNAPAKVSILELERNVTFIGTAMRPKPSYEIRSFKSTEDMLAFLAGDDTKEKVL